jgi:hypothetical protein
VLLTEYFSGNEIEKNEVGGACSKYGVRVELYTGIWWGQLEGKRPLGRPRRRWDYNIKMYLQEVGLVGMGPDLYGSG